MRHARVERDAATKFQAILSNVGGIQIDLFLSLSSFELNNLNNLNETKIDLPQTCQNLSNNNTGRSTAQRIDCNKLLMKASHGLTQCPPKVSRQAKETRRKNYTATHNSQECALSYMLSVHVSLSPSIACFFMVSLEKSFVYKHFGLLRKHCYCSWRMHVKKWLKVIFDPLC